ncbi:MAG: alpha-2-macroglobulin family protein [Flavobacteriales bacterium]
MRTILLALATLAVLVGLGAQRPVVKKNKLVRGDPRWARVDSLQRQGLYDSALDLVEVIGTDARHKGDWRAEFRAWAMQAVFRDQLGHAPDTIIRRMEDRIAQADTGELPFRQLMHSKVAGLYWSTYQRERWQVLERTDLEAAQDTADLSTWDQRTFMRTIVRHLRASLEPADSLWAYPSSDLGELLDGAERGVAYRPTLFDLLAHRAIAVFSNSESRLAEPAWHFKLDDLRAFALFEDFAFRTFRHRDSVSWEFQTLRLYQELTRRHLSDATPDALVDNELSRLRFVHDRSTHPRKDTLHLQALETLRSRLPNDSCWAEVTVELARWHNTQAAKYDRLAGDAWKNERRTALALCEEAIARFPKSTGAVNARRLKAELQQAGLELHAEEVVLPDKAFRIAADLTNVKQVWLRVVKGPSADRWNKEGVKRLLKLHPVQAWSVVVPDDGDLNQHRVELPVDALPPGQYTLLASNSAAFTYEKDIVTSVNFQVSQLTWTQRRVAKGIEVLVVHRGSGRAVQGATVTMRTHQRTATGWQWNRIMDRTTDTDGVAFFGPGEYNGQYIFDVKALGEERTTDQRHYYDPGRPTTEEPRTFLFTDRAIYRPGQTIHFKGIVTLREGRAVSVMPQHRTTIRFFDVNSQQLDTFTVTTDGYGAFHGTFTAPRGALTGRMRIAEAHGEAWVSVEEYKRPTFEVVFDPVTATPKLGGEATVSGVAKSYAGAPLDGAQVQWTVMRSARMPWWCGWGWRGFPGWGTSTEVASGTATTDAQGKFTIAFKAKADNSLPRAADPTFDFNVSATVTDINGESQPGSTALSVGYRGIDIDIALGAAIDRSTTDSIGVLLRNLNGQPVDLPMDVRIVRLETPRLPLRPRLWERPDRFVLTAEEHAQQFPGEVYAQEDDDLTWPAANTALERTMWKAGGQALKLGDVRSWPVGRYRIEVSTKDAEGVPLTVRKTFTVLDPEIQNTGFVTEGFHAEGVKLRAEPGEKAVFLLSTALPEAHVLMEVERGANIAVRRWFTLKAGQQRVEVPVMEDDRGGFTVHLLCVERDRVHQEQITIEVPWTNKELRVEWMSFRDKLLPGAQEEWRLRISGPKGEQVAAQLLTAMYDASLDAFVPHQWNMSLWGSNYAERAWQGADGFGERSGDRLWWGNDLPWGYSRAYPTVKYLWGAGDERQLRSYGWNGDADLAGRGIRTVQFAAAEEVAEDRVELGNVSGALAKADTQGTYAFSVTNTNGATTSIVPEPVAQPVRTNFNETAFFFPDLLTDRDGSVVLRFTLPDALTRWKLLGLAHTTDMRTAEFTRTAVAQKPLMVVPNLPRFVRAGDRITLTAKVNALEQRIEGRATLALFDPFTNAPLDKAFGLKVPQQVFVAAPGESGVVEWSVVVPENVDAVAVRMVAQGGGGPVGGSTAADGEERVLPVLTDKLLVTESLPLAVSKAGTKSFALEKLKRSSASGTLQHKSLTLEFTPNPAWYAVQALPYLMEFPYECAEQTFSRYYANRLAAHIVAERPAIKQMFEQWKSTAKGGGPDAFASALERNAELKGMVLAETPWVLDVQNERARKERIALLFDLQRMATEEATALKKLKDMQLPNGAWPWWTGMRESVWITEHIVAGLGHLEKLNAADVRENAEANAMLKRAVRWMDQDLERRYRDLRKHLKAGEEKTYRPGSDVIHWLYARSFFTRWPIDGATATAANYYRDRLAATWLDHGLQEQAMLALIFQRFSMPQAAQVMRSVKERATVSEELGMYWPNFNGGYDWWSFPTETHALMIEAFHEVAKDPEAVNALRQYLLKLKQTTDWKTTKATADACYALLLTGDNWLDAKDAPVITVGGTKVDPKNMEPGTGRFEQHWSGSEVKPAMGDVRVTTARDGVQWGALHWQYLERMDKVTAHESPFSLRKQVMLAERTDEGTRLVALNGPRQLKVGDQVTIRIELRTDRYLDFVHLKDLRAAGLEATEALSGYRYQGGLGYYQSIRDASMDFFFDRIAPGTYVFEYALRVTHAGDFSNGITTAMCMYAPEFSSHSEGVRVKVQQP